MDFIKVSVSLLGDFAKADVRYAVIGGFAPGSAVEIRLTGNFLSHISNCFLLMNSITKSELPMTKLRDQEMQDLLQDAASATRRSDFRHLTGSTSTLSPMEFLHFLNYASTFSRESASERKLPVEKVMLV